MDTGAKWSDTEYNGELREWRPLGVADPNRVKYHIAGSQARSHAHPAGSVSSTK